MKRLFLLLMFTPVLLYGQVFQATFESNSLTADVGDETYSNSAVIANPYPDDINSSDYVVRFRFAFNDGDTDITARYKMDSGEGVDGANRTQVYAWKTYFVGGCFDTYDISTSYFMNIYKSSRVVVESFSSDSILYDCVDGTEIKLPILYDQWVSYVLEVYYSYTGDGYYRMFVNDDLVFSIYDIDTMTSESDTTGARMLAGGRLILGEESSTNLIYYSDDLYVYDLNNEGVTIEELMPELNISNNVAVSTAAEIETYATGEYDTVFISNDITEDFTISNSGIEGKPIFIYGGAGVDTLSGNVTVTGDYVIFENVVIIGDLIRE